MIAEIDIFLLVCLNPTRLPDLEQKALKKKEALKIDIVSMHDDGYGLSADGRHGVFGSLPGETVMSRPITRRRKRLFSRAEVIDIPAENRVEPRCSAAGYCGGCSLQHMSCESQLNFKQERLRREFALTMPEEWLTPLSENVFNYRSKARLGVKFVDKKDRVLVGFREKMKPYIADIDTCHVLREPVATLMGPLAELIGKLNNPRTVPQIEVAIGDTETALIFRHLEPLVECELESFRLFGRQRGVQVYLQPGNLDSVYQLYPENGNERLHYCLPEYDLSFSFHPLDFTQVNPEVNRKMVRLALALLETSTADRVLDAFCGIGNFSLAIALSVKTVLGLESLPSSVERAKENALRNNICNVQFEIADLFADQIHLPGFDKFNKVLVDPPRSGALELCKKLASSRVERVVYVSCNPKTLARDASLLVEKGFRLRKLGIIDMFPHTTHVESIALFTR